MALGSYMTKALLKRLKPGARIASMGYPDMIAPLDMLEEYVDVRSLEYRKDSEAICKRHGLSFRGIPDAHAFFKALGCELDVYDIVQERGCEILCDLNRPYLGRNDYEFVLDVGTLEHVVNIWQAAFNMTNRLKVGGVIFHENPFNWGNHGFYNLNPTWYADVYSQNGWKLIEFKLIMRDGRIADPPLTNRFQFMEGEANSFAIAEKLKALPLEYVVQTKYKKLIPDAGVRAEQKEVANG